LCDQFDRIFVLIVELKGSVGFIGLSRRSKQFGVPTPGVAGSVFQNEGWNVGSTMHNSISVLEREDRQSHALSPSPVLTQAV
jgi:hypothetical protein